MGWYKDGTKDMLAPISKKLPMRNLQLVELENGVLLDCVLRIVENRVI
jgi:hypothetical protein